MKSARQVPFSRELFIEREDFMERPPKKFHRLRPGGEVRLRYAYIVKCERVVKDERGDIAELICTYDPTTRSGSGGSDRSVPGTIHWVSAKHTFRAPVRLYDRLFSAPFPGTGGRDFLQDLNPSSLKSIGGAALEPGLANARSGEVLQFERLGYFCVDTVDSAPGRPVFNRTVTLRDTWARIERQALDQGPPV
jgi:glutaminyl-tRNA synthetase